MSSRWRILLRWLGALVLWHVPADQPLALPGFPLVAAAFTAPFLAMVVFIYVDHPDGVRLDYGDVRPDSGVKHGLAGSAAAGIREVGWSGI